RVDPLLDACPAGIVDENERAAGLESPLHDLGYFEGVDFSCGAAEHREILARKVDQTAVDGAGAGHDPIRGNFLVGHAEMHLAVLSEQTEFLETAGIDKGIDAFTGRELPVLLVPGQALGAAALLEALPFLAEILRQPLHRFPELGGHRYSPNG